MRTLNEKCSGKNSIEVRLSWQICEIEIKFLLMLGAHNVLESLNLWFDVVNRTLPVWVIGIRLPSLDAIYSGSS